MKKLEKPQFDMETIIDNCLVHMQNPRKKRITLVKEKIKKKTGGKIFPPVKSSVHISYINMIFIFLNYSIDFNRIRTDL